MTKNYDWRSPNSADTLKQLNRAGFAWEFLRRNQEYRAGYERIVGSANNNEPEMANAAANFARHWGLHCRRRPCIAGKTGKCTMAAGKTARRRAAFKSTKWLSANSRLTSKYSVESGRHRESRRRDSCSASVRAAVLAA
jgi:hypothetical protein